MAEHSMTRAEWRRARKISKASHYKLKRLGLAPDDDGSRLTVSC